MIDNLLLLLFLLLLIHYLLFLFRVYSGLKKLSSDSQKKIPDEFVSVLIPFRNEERNILQVLKSVESQDYPSDKFEVIFIDDNSVDKSKELLEKNISRNNIRVITVPDDYSVNAHKKRAIRFGIENSKGEIIVTTDADCIHKKSWLKTLLSFFDDKTGFVSGPVKFFEGKSLFSRLQELEFAGLVTTGAGLIGSNNPTICNAANITYRRKVFDLVGGFSLQMNLSSGDDELLMQKVFRDTEFKIKFALDKNAIVETEPNKSLKNFYQQRKRWASKGLFYKNKMLVLKLVLIYLFYISFVIQPILGLIVDFKFLISFIISFIAKMLVEFLILKKGIELLFDKKILNVFLLAELFHIPYIVIAGISGALGNYKWKDRTIRR
ncbi:Glycosyltransferase [Ignavibacterium album JCM 16511]|uniref:Glycosyltransferase n=1 Tax=Ignavibacterium album (strain DSM 19864 / JCM 16511 / NBRC 101810 / Mat9-16) TaxID=945713 RepID=I0AKK0_IGNAJ|nr:glycosyltransferase [Ignavibacterium album]AFH49507.1 Glycosyltransferase [Ignavibacterium album JCM 16511]